ncbi:MAG: DUF928 domain-containing protein, partial [Pyrinomonadaceae bacterium]
MIVCKLTPFACRLLLTALVAAALGMTSFHFTTQAQNPPKQSGPRRPLPKPPTGSRGFEQAGRDASSRLIAAAATRGPLKPIAPYEGLAYKPSPLFAWTPAPGANSYHFMLRDGTDSSDAIVYETDVKLAQLVYPAEAPALTPGKLYSWRISTAGVLERKLGMAATFFVIAGEDAAQVTTALQNAKLALPKSAAERLAQARLFEQYGIWYDALRIASELLNENENDAEARAFYDSLIKQLKDEAAKAASQASSLSLPLWREIEPLVVAGNEAAALAAINRNRSGASALYREFLFDAVDSRLYNNPPISPNAERVRTLLAQSDTENAALEGKLTAWSKERKLGEGFTNAGDPIEQLLYLYIASEPSNIKNQKVSAEQKPATSRELTEAALQTAEAIGDQLAIAACASNLAYYALQERRATDMRPLIERAGEIWKTWRHPVGIAVAAYLTGESSALIENWNEASTNYKQALQLAFALPALRPLRLAALNALAWSLRNLGDKEGVLVALTTEVEEQQKFVDTITDQENHIQQAKRLSDFQIELGGALAALNRYAEAGEWYARADRIRDENYRIERAKYEKTATEWEAKLKAAKSDTTLDKAKRDLEIMRASIILDANLLFWSNHAAERKDLATMAAIAERRIAAARESGIQEKLADALDAAAKAYRTANDLSKARLFAEEALRLRSADARRRSLYSSVEILADIAYDADQTREAESRYRELLEITKPGVLPPPYDLSVEPDQAIRQIRASMNAGERTSRQFSAIDAHMALA